MAACKPKNGLLFLGFKLGNCTKLAIVLTFILGQLIGREENKPTLERV
ncbi:hypothetical protein [Litorimonas sp.]